MHPDEEAFLRSIAECPEDDTPRLVYADWLEEQGGEANAARAEYIRLQIDIHRKTAGKGCAELLGVPPGWDRRELVLHNRWVTRWRKPYTRRRGLTHSYTFRRGFIEDVGMPMAEFARAGEEILAALPVLGVCPYLNDREDLELLFRSPWLARIRRLWVIGFNPTEFDAFVRGLTESPFTTGLRELSVSNQWSTDEGMRALAASPLLTQLESLDFQAVFRFDLHLETLCASPHLRKLRRLRIGFPLPSDRSLSIVSRSQLPLGLETLEVEHNVLGTEGLAHLASVKWPKLDALNLGSVAPTIGGLAALSGADGMPMLRRLAVNNCSVGTERIRALLGGPLVAQLQGLGLRGNRLSDGSMEALARSPRLGSLEHLNVSYNPFTSWGVQSLLDSPHLSRLTFLECEGPKVRLADKVRKRLRERFGTNVAY